MTDDLRDLGQVLAKNMPCKERKRGGQLGMLLALALVPAAVAQEPQPGVEPSQSAHRPGPDGLEGWTLEWAVRGTEYGDERFAFALVIARDGHVMRRIDGDPIIWSWIFWSGGQQIAYETGPFHFKDTCLLIRLADGHQLAGYDCYHEQPLAKPDWVWALEASK